MIIFNIILYIILVKSNITVEDNLELSEKIPKLYHNRDLPR